MKYIVMCCCLLLGNVSFADVVRLSEPVSSDEFSETFGAAIKASENKVALGKVMNKPSDVLGKELVVETQIQKVCQKKGCFFIAQAGEQVIRVSFKDYGFFIPSDSAGKQVLMKGTLIEKTLSKEKAEHFNKDLNTGKQAFSEGKTYEFVASAIKIPK